MSRIIVPLHLANLVQVPSGADAGFKKLYLRANWMKLHDGISETDLVLDRPLDNFNPIPGTITALDTVLTALEKLQYNVTNVSVTGYVPYIGATGDVNLGQNNIYTSGGAQLYDDGTVQGESFQFTSNFGSLQSPGYPGNVWLLPNNTGIIALLSDLASYYPLTGNPSNFITSSALTPYLTSATAASTYFPIPTGTIAQYIRGNGTLATFPTIPTVGTWGALNYPTWTTGTPFVKMTAAGTFALDTNTYAIDSNVVHKTGDETIDGIKTFSGTATIKIGLNTLNGQGVFGGVSSGYSGTNFYSQNQGTGIGLYADTFSTGIAAKFSTSGIGDSIVSGASITSTGRLFVGINGLTETLIIDKLGNITGNSFVKTEQNGYIRIG